MSTVKNEKGTIVPNTELFDVKERVGYAQLMARGQRQHEVLRAGLSERDVLLVDALHYMGKVITEHMVTVAQATLDWLATEDNDILVNALFGQAVATKVRKALELADEAANILDFIREGIAGKAAANR